MSFLNSSQFGYVLLTLCLFLVMIFAFLMTGIKYYFAQKGSKPIRNIKNYRSLPPSVRTIIDLALLLLFVFSMILLVLRPTGGIEYSQTSTTNLDIAFVVDTSLSMNVDDFDGSKEVNRLEGVQEVIPEIIKSRNDRFALISFSDKATIELPLTFDKQSAITGIETLIIVDSFDAQGTALSSAFEEADKRLISSKDPFGGERQKIIIFISDGEQTSKAQTNFEEAVEQSVSKGIRVFTLGVGSTSGGKVVSFVSNDGEIYYARFKGQEVISKLNEENLKSIAEIGQGKYYHLTDSFDVAAFSQDLDQLITEEPIVGQEVTYKEMYHLIAPFSLLLLLLIIFRLQNVTLKTHRQKGSFTKSLALRSIHPALIVLLFPLFAFLFNLFVFLGNKDYKNDNYLRAVSNYDKAIEFGIDQDGIAHHNKADALYRSEKYQEAIEEYENAINEMEKSGRDEHKEQTYYNLGNAHYRNGQKYLESDVDKTIEEWEAAIKAYEEALAINPDDTEARENLEFVKKKLEELKKKKEEQKKDDDKTQPEPEPQPEPVDPDDVEKIKEKEKESKKGNAERRKYWDPDNQDDDYNNYDEPYW